jgi:hypothetical protein
MHNAIQFIYNELTYLEEIIKAVAHKISKGQYQYRGFDVVRLGYYPPERHTVWEASDPLTGAVVAHGYTKRECLARIDEFLRKDDKSCQFGEVSL